jgi:hypothetical protein
MGLGAKILKLKTMKATFYERSEIKHKDEQSSSNQSTSN